MRGSYETVDNRKDSTRKQEEQRTITAFAFRDVEEPLQNYEPEAPKTEEESIDFEIKF